MRRERGREEKMASLTELKFWVEEKRGLKEV